MLQKIRKMMKNDKGFTLVELMVVVVILGILAAIAIPKFTGQKQKAIDSKIAADIKILQDAYDLYYFEAGVQAADPGVLASAGYLKEAPSDPDGPGNADGKTYQITAGKVEYKE